MSAGFLLTKLARALVTLWICVTFVFVVLRVSGDPVSQLVGDSAPPEVRAYYAERFGLDEPIPVQYLRYVSSVLRGDLGVSFSDETPALDVVLEAIPRTLELGLAAMALSLAVGIPLGVVAALNRNGAADRVVMAFAAFGFAMPNFFLGILLILLFALAWRVLPSSGSGTLWHLILPMATLGFHNAANFARFTRSSVLEILNRPYIRTAKAKGLGPTERMVRHVAPNAAIPVVTILGFRLGEMIAGFIAVETVFAWPGMGRLLVNAVSARDLAVVQTVLLLAALAMVVANLAVDLLYGWLDPRVRAARGGAGAPS